jgi:hypothetical protein
MFSTRGARLIATPVTGTEVLYGAGGGAVTVAANAKYGIPCVF